MPVINGIPYPTPPQPVSRYVSPVSAKPPYDMAGIAEGGQGGSGPFRNQQHQFSAAGIGNQAVSNGVAPVNGAAVGVMPVQLAPLVFVTRQAGG